MNLYAFDWERKFKNVNLAQFGPGEVRAPNMVTAVFSGRLLIAEINGCSVDDIEITSIEFESVVKDEYGPRVAVRGDFMPDGWRPQSGCMGEAKRYRDALLVVLEKVVPTYTDSGDSDIEAIVRKVLGF